MTSAGKGKNNIERNLKENLINYERRYDRKDGTWSMHRKFAALTRKRSIAMQSRQRVHTRSAKRTNFICSVSKGIWGQ